MGEEEGTEMLASGREGNESASHAAICLPNHQEKEREQRQSHRPACRQPAHAREAICNLNPS